MIDQIPRVDQPHDVDLIALLERGRVFLALRRRLGNPGADGTSFDNDCGGSRHGPERRWQRR
jgi:hypothetical protein